jgi:transcriptional regulator with XRE-family HTH domain
MRYVLSWVVRNALLSYYLCIKNKARCAMTALLQQAPQPQLVLAKAVLNAAEQLGLKQAELAAVLGVHRTAVSRLKQNPALDPASKQGELALLLIRIARALYSLAGGDPDWIKHFMHNPNKFTGGIPAQQVQSIQGLMQVLQFVDAMRGKL